MGIIKGDIKRALGISTIKIGEIEIDLSKSKAIDVVEFQELSIKAWSGKNMEELNADDLLAASKITTDWFVNYFKKYSPDTDVEDIEMLVAKNKAELQKEFTIGFGIKSREKYDEDETTAKEKLAKKESSLLGN